MDFCLNSGSETFPKFGKHYVYRLVHMLHLSFAGTLFRASQILQSVHARSFLSKICFGVYGVDLTNRPFLSFSFAYNS